MEALELTAEEKLAVRDVEVLELRAFNTVHDFKNNADRQLQEFQAQAQLRAKATGECINALATKRGLDPARFAFDFGALKFVEKNPAKPDEKLPDADKPLPQDEAKPN